MSNATATIRFITNLGDKYGLSEYWYSSNPVRMLSFMLRTALKQHVARYEASSHQSDHNFSSHTLKTHKTSNGYSLFGNIRQKVRAEIRPM